jgi:hypothetical protein
MNWRQRTERIRESLEKSLGRARATLSHAIQVTLERLADFGRELLRKIIAVSTWAGCVVRWASRLAIWSMIVASVVLVFLIHPALRAAVFVPIIIVWPYWILVKKIYRMTYRSDLSAKMVWDRLQAKAFADVKGALVGVLWYAVFFCLVSVYFTFLVLGPVAFSSYLLLRPASLDDALRLMLGAVPADASFFHLLLNYYLVTVGCFMIGAMFYFLRSIRRTGYAVLEVAVGVILVSANFDTLVTLLGYFLAFERGLLDWLLHGADRAALLSIAGGFYVIVRGLDNLEKGVKPDTPAGVFLTELPKEIEEEVDGHRDTILLSMKAMIGRAK